MYYAMWHFCSIRNGEWCTGKAHRAHSLFHLCATIKFTLNARARTLGRRRDVASKPRKQNGTVRERRVCVKNTHAEIIMCSRQFCERAMFSVLCDYKMPAIVH